MAQANRRRHGFQCPWHPAQLAGWAAFVLILSVFYGLYTRLLAPSEPAAVALSVCLYLAAAVLWCAACYCQCVDPCDPALATDHPRARTSGGSGAMPIDPDRNWCARCCAAVKARSVHCRECHKCVDRYDHHCPWLNTCIGARNYNAFLVMLGSALVVISLHLIGLAHAAAKLPELSAQLDAHGITSTTYAIALIVAAVVLLIVWVQLVVLAQLHAKLLCIGVTTYEYFQRYDEEPSWTCGAIAIAAARRWVSRVAPSPTI